jgi:hypothetical protein
MMKPYLLFGLTIVGCGKKPGDYESSIEAAKAAEAEGIRASADAAWVNRSDKAELTSALEKYEQVFKANPQDRDVAYHLVRGWYFMGDAHESETEQKLAAWNKAVAFGDSCLSINNEFAALLEKSGDKAEAADAITMDDIPCVYWTASALGKWAKTKGLSTTLKHIPTAKAYIAKVSEIHPDYFYGAADRYWGAYYSGLPSFAGQDLDKSQGHFKASMTIAPGNLGTRVLYADYWAVKTQNIEVFDEMIQYAMAADPEALISELVPENHAEKKKAEALWAARSDKFLDATEPKPLGEQPPTVSEAPAEEAASEDAATEEAAPTGEEEETAPAGSEATE